MPTSDLRDYLHELESINELRLARGVDWNVEMGTIAEVMNEREGPALLFDEVKDYPAGYRVACGLISTPRRLAVALGLSRELSPIEVVRSLKDLLRSLKPVEPLHVDGGPIMENVMEGNNVDLTCFPAPKWHEHDGGRYIGTGCMVIMKDPESEWVNVGTYRVQLHDRETLGIYISPGHQGRWIRDRYWSQGKSCPVAVVLGCSPALWMHSFLTFPWGTSEYTTAGGLLAKPVELVAGKHTGLPIPAFAELVIEGEIPPMSEEAREEGPFGEWTGYYASNVRKEAVIRVKRVMYRNDPIILGSPPLRPPANDAPVYLFGAANLWNELERVGVPDIKGVWQLRPGGRRYFTVISIRQRYSGHAKQAAMAAMSGPEGAYHGRFVIVVDEDIDPSNTDEVLWAIGTRCDPASSIDIIRECWSTPLDPILDPEKRGKREFSNSRAIILACKPFSWQKDFPRVSRASEEQRSAVLKKWKSLFAG